MLRKFAFSWPSDPTILARSELLPYHLLSRNGKNYHVLRRQVRSHQSPGHLQKFKRLLHQQVFHPRELIADFR